MSKSKNGGLDQHGAGPFEQQQFGTAGVKKVNNNTDTYTHRHTAFLPAYINSSASWSKKINLQTSFHDGAIWNSHSSWLWVNSGNNWNQMISGSLLCLHRQFSITENHTSTSRCNMLQRVLWMQGTDKHRLQNEHIWMKIYTVSQTKFSPLNYL